MIMYVLVWSFTNFVEAPYTFKSLESCTSKLKEMAYVREEGRGECVSTEVK